MWGVLYLFIFVVEGSVDHKQDALRGFVLHQSNPPCHDVDTNKLILIKTNQDDYDRLRLGNSAPGQLNIRCKDGSNNMTCLPLSLGPTRYYCACDSKKGDLNTEIGMTGRKSQRQDLLTSEVSVIRKLAGVSTECSLRTWCIW